MKPPYQQTQIDGKAPGTERYRIPRYYRTSQKRKNKTRRKKERNERTSRSTSRILSVISHRSSSFIMGSNNDGVRRAAVLRRLYTATILCTCFLIVEVIGGLWAHSLAVLSDAAHLLADLASFAVASKYEYTKYIFFTFPLLLSIFLSHAMHAWLVGWLVVLRKDD